MKKEKIDFKKSLGQNFIFDTNLLNAIALDGLVDKSDTVLEIGAGAGSLTKVLTEKAKQVISFEIDKSLSVYLDKIDASNLTLYYQDFLQADISKIVPNNTRVIANIPYYITTPIIFKLVDNLPKFKSILVLIQKEVALRFSAQPNSKDYGITSVILQSIFDVKITRIVKRECFTPSPKIDSATVLLVPHNKYKIDNFELFKNFARTAFSMRRKTLINNLKSSFDKQKIESALNNFNFNLMIRPEEISVENFINLYNFLKNS